MSRIEQGLKEKGSQKWLQRAVNERPEILDSEIRQKSGLDKSSMITWLSPLSDDDYAEYRDEEMLKKLGVTPGKRQLSSFWPKQGPVWDGLAKAATGELFLVEAKAHIPEAVSGKSGAGEKSLEQIKQALQETREHLGVKSPSDWSDRFYQYTNRLAFLYYLRVINELPAYLVFCHFYGDDDVEGPSTKEHWEGAIEVVKTYLGVRKHRLQDFVIDLFIDVAQLRSLGWGREVGQ